MARDYARDTTALLTAEDVADAWRVSPRHVRRLAKEGELVAIRVGEKRLRFTLEDVEAYLDRQRGAKS